jgi:hypothetical protein
LVRHRHKLRQLCSGLKAGAHAVLAKNGLLIPRSDMFGVDGRRRLQALTLPEAFRVRLDSQLHLIDTVEAEIEDLDGRIRGLFDADAGYRALRRPRFRSVICCFVEGSGCSVVFVNHTAEYAVASDQAIVGDGG